LLSRDCLPFAEIIHKYTILSSANSDSLSPTASWFATMFFATSKIIGRGAMLSGRKPVSMFSAGHYAAFASRYLRPSTAYAPEVPRQIGEIGTAWIGRHRLVVRINVETTQLLGGQLLEQMFRSGAGIEALLLQFPEIDGAGKMLSLQVVLLIGSNRIPRPEGRSGRRNPSSSPDERDPLRASLPPGRWLRRGASTRRSIPPRGASAHLPRLKRQHWRPDRERYPGRRRCGGRLPRG